MISLGFDPGSKQSAFALAVRKTTGLKDLRFIVGGMVKSTVEAIEAMPELDVVPKGSLVAVETPKGGIYGKARASALLETARVASDIAGVLRARGYRVLRPSSQEARRALCGSRSGRGGAFGDQDVSRAIQLLVRDCPKINVHVRDALLVAVLALLNPNAVEAT